MATSNINKLHRNLYKKLITVIAAELSEADVRNLAYQNDINSYTGALDIFTQLEKLGRIGSDKITELEDILTNINRMDLVTKLKETNSKNEGQKISGLSKLNS